MLSIFHVFAMCTELWLLILYINFTKPRYQDIWSKTSPDNIKGTFR